MYGLGVMHCTPRVILEVHHHLHRWQRHWGRIKKFAVRMISIEEGSSFPVSTRAAYIGLDNQFTVYFGELYGLLLTLEILGEPSEYQDTWPMIIYTDNQSAIRDAHNSQSRSGQYMLARIIRLLGILHRYIEIH